MELFHDELSNGTWLMLPAAFTPGSARRLATSCFTSASASGLSPRLPMLMRTISSFAMPVGRSMRSRRWVMRKTALQMMAHDSATSSTISAAAVLWRARVERMGRMSMTCLLDGWVTGS